MTTFNPRLFSSPESLRRMRLNLLRELLAPFREYLADRGIEIIGQGVELAHLAGVLMNPSEDTPIALLNDLYFVDEMASAEGMDALQEEIHKLPPTQQALFEIDEDIAPADLAVMVRLRLPELLERKHAERMISSRRSFVYFRSRTGELHSRRPIGSGQVSALEVDLASCMEALRRGPKAKVFVFERPDGTWLLIRRGDPLTRDGALQGEESTSVVYRPERYDVAHLDHEQGLVGLNVVGDVKKIREAYSDLLALHLFGERGLFVPTDQYTLEPLRQLDPASIACSDVDGLDAVVLKELHIYWDGPEGETEIRRARNVIAALVKRSRPIHDSAKLVRATFNVTFSGSRPPRAITIKTPDRLSYTRDSDALLVKDWLIRRGFLLPGAN